MNPKLVILAVISSIFLLGAGTLFLSPKSTKVNDLSCDLPLENSNRIQSDQINVSVNVDGSGSMLGYVKNNNSRYVKILDVLNDTFALANSSNSKVEYYRSGGISNQKLTDSEFQKAKQPEFYDNTNKKFPGVGSGLDSAITPPGNGNQLFVLVTDLYQNEANVTKLNTKIKETYFNKNKKGYAVGVLAIKSEFNGKIYLENKDDFPYNTEGKKTESFRPFYILLLGPYNDIVHYLDQLKNNAKDIFNDSEAVIFSPNNLVSSLSSLSKSQPIITKEVQEYLKEIKSLNSSSVKVKEDNSSIQMLEITKKLSQSLSIPYTADFSQLDYLLAIDYEQIETNIEGEKLNTKPKQKINNAKEILQLQGWKVENNKLNFTTNIQPQATLEKPGIYYFTANVIAKELQEQPWWQQWTATASSDASKDGSKTHNLSRFMRGLKTITTTIMADEQPIIGRVCYAIQKK
jgi:hypothetical protein